RVAVPTRAPEDADEALFSSQQSLKPEVAGASLDTREVMRWLYRRSTAGLSFRDQVKALLSEAEFAPRAGLTREQQAQRSMARFQLLRERLDLRSCDVHARPERLVTALELLGVVDAPLFRLLNHHYCLCGATLLRSAGRDGEIDHYIRE